MIGRRRSIILSNAPITNTSLRTRPEHPPLQFCFRSFCLANVAEFEWRTLIASNAFSTTGDKSSKSSSTKASFDSTTPSNGRSQKLVSSGLSTLTFSQRTYGRHLYQSTSPSLSIQDEANVLTPSNYRPPAAAASSNTEIPEEPHDTTVNPIPFSAAEVILSRAIELEAFMRSDESNGVAIFPMSCWFASEPIYTFQPQTSPSGGRSGSTLYRFSSIGPRITSDTPRSPPSTAETSCSPSDPHSSRISTQSGPSLGGNSPASDDGLKCIVVQGPILRPATYGMTPEPGKMQINVTNANSGDVNELRWLFASVENAKYATLFTRIVETRVKAPGNEFHLLLDEPVVCHPFRLVDPWRVAWKWLSKPSFKPMAPYLLAVGSTWCPVPDGIEASWVYTLDVEWAPRSGIVSCTIDAKEESKNTIPLAVDARKRGFTQFLWDVIAYWRGFFRPLASQPNWIPPNDDLACIAALALRRNLSLLSRDTWIAGKIPLIDAVRACWQLADCPTTEWAAPEASGVQDVRLCIPMRLRTLDFTLDASALKKKEEIVMKGYKLISGPDENVRLGISSAGLYCSIPFLLASYLQSPILTPEWVFDIEPGFGLESVSFGILFVATHMNNVEAKYDDVYARYFLGPCPFGAVADWPRSCYIRTLEPNKQRLLFSKLDSNDVRGEALLKLLSGLETNGGLLHLRCKSIQEVLCPSARRSDVVLHLVTSIAKMNNTQSPQRNRMCLGRIKTRSLTPGCYRVADLAPILEHLNPWDSERLEFCILSQSRGEIEVYEHTNELPESQHGDANIEVISMKEYHELHA